MKKVYVVTSYLGGNLMGSATLVGVFSDQWMALRAAAKHNRNGNQHCQIREVILDSQIAGHDVIGKRLPLRKAGVA